MEVKQLTQNTVGYFNERSFRQNARQVADESIVVMDIPTGQQMQGVSGLIQYSEGFIDAMPELKGTALEHKTSGNKVTTRVRATGIFMGRCNLPKALLPAPGSQLTSSISSNRSSMTPASLSTLPWLTT